MTYTSQTYAAPGEPAYSPEGGGSAVGEMMVWARKAACSSDLIDALSDSLAAILAGFGPGSLA